MQMQPSPLTNGTLLFNRYHVISLLGQGGMSRVYLAQDTRLNIRVAVKENLQVERQARTQFQREAQLLAGLTHPNLPRVTDHFDDTATGRQYLVMDYIEGDDLETITQRGGPLAEPEARAWINQILDAVEYLHRQNPPIIHRDIKPSNIKITPQGKAVLVDFGIAKMYDPRGLTLTGARSVTPGYAPPEQYGMHTDQRSDVYALGATLYKLVTGRVPPEATLRMSNVIQLTPPRQLRPDLSPTLEGTIARAMEVDTQRRLQSIAELRAALVGAAPYPAATAAAPAAQPTARVAPAGTPLQTQPATAPPAFGAPPAIPAPAASVPTAPPRAARSSGPWLWVGLAVLGLCALGAIGGGIFLFSNPGQFAIALGATPTAKVSVVTPELGVRGDTAETPRILATLPIAPSATLTVPPLSPTALPSATSSSTARPAATATATRVPPTAIPPTPVPPRAVLSGQIAYTVWDGGKYQIYMMKADGTGSHPLVQQASEPDFSPDKTKLLYYHWTDGVWLANADGSDGRHVIHDSEAGGAVWSPDGSRFVYYTLPGGRGNFTIFVVTADGRNPVTIGFGRRPVWSPDGGRIAFDGCAPGTSDCGVMIQPSGGGDPQRPTLITRDAGGNPAWSPKGDWIVYQVNESTGAVHLWMVRPDGSGRKQLTFASGIHALPMWSRDGNFIFWRGGEGGVGWGIYAMSPDGTNVRRLIDAQVNPQRWQWEKMAYMP